MEKGVAFYPGMGHSTPEAADYLEAARNCGFTRLFTSLHIPEANADTILSEFRSIMAEAVGRGFAVTADISPRTFRMLEASPADIRFFKELGLSALRLDFGFSVEEIAAWTRCGLMIELNASTIDERMLQAILDAGADEGKIQACHNYYPRPETGLSSELFSARSRTFRSRSMPVTAFVPSMLNPRGPLHEGLPTLERHRRMNTLQAAKEMIWGGEVDCVMIADPLASLDELRQVGAIEADVVELQVEVMACASETEKEILFAGHTNRMDPGEWVVRSAEARALARGTVAEVRTMLRPLGSVTIDNSAYQRYMGELQIVRADLPADSRVNVVARVIPEERFLIDCIRPGMKFRLVPVN